MTAASSRPGASIASVVTLALVVVITVLLGVAGVVVYRSVSDTRWEDLRKSHRTLADQLAVGFASPLWNFDRPTIGKIAEGAFHEETISGLVVLAGRVDVADQRLEQVGQGHEALQVAVLGAKLLGWPESSVADPS